MTDEDIANAIAANDVLKQAETYDQITKRTIEAMDEIIKVTQEAGGGNALVVSTLVTTTNHTTSTYRCN